MKKLIVLFALVAFIAVNVAPVYAAADNSIIVLVKVDDEPKKDAKAEEKADNKTEATGDNKAEATGDNKAEATCDNQSESQSEANCESKPAGNEAAANEAACNETAAKKDCCAQANNECGDEKK